MTKGEQAIRDVVDRWVRASATEDVATMATLLADDIVFIVPGQPPFGRKEFKAAWGRTDERCEGQSECVEEGVLISGDFAFTGTRLAVGQRAGWCWLLARDANLLTPEN